MALTSLNRMMSTNDNDAIKRRRLGSPGVHAVPASRDDAVLRLEQRMESMEASFRREIAEVKRVADMEFLAKSSAIESRLTSLQNETDRLKARVAQLDEENRRLVAGFKVHVGNLDWEYDVPDPPPDSYWIDQGYDYGNENITDDDYIDNINSEFFSRIKEQSEDLRRGTFGLQNDSEILYFGPYQDEPLIRYDDALLPHWREFCDSMVNWQFALPMEMVKRPSHLFSVYFCSIELPPNVVLKLRECFMSGGIGHVKAFHLTRNEFQGSNGIEFALNMIQTHQTMIEFDYSRNPADNDRDCQRLVDAIVSHPNISTCFLNCLCGGEINGHDYLVSLLREDRLQKVGFAGCGVNTNGQSTLFDIIKVHPNLKWLGLNGNKLSDEDAIQIAGVLRCNRTLEELFLHGNEFSLSGDDILKKVVYDDSSLNAVADSNHVCRIFGREFYNEDIYGGHICYVYRNDSHLGLQI